MEKERKFTSEEYIQGLVGEPVSFGYKLHDCDLFMMGFGKFENKPREECVHRIHAQCEIKVVNIKNYPKEVYWFDADSSEEEFDEVFSKLIGKRVTKAYIDKERNDLVIKMEDWGMVLFTYPYEIEEGFEYFDYESYRYFRMFTEEEHLVVARDWIEF